DVTLAPGSDRFNVAHRKILELLLHRVIELFFAAARSTAQRYRVRGANRGSRRHCCDARCNSNETTGAGCGRPGWSHINHHWHSRAQEALHDRLGRIEQAARGVELNYQALCVLCPGFVDASRNVTRRRRTNRSVDFDETNFLCSNRCCAQEPENQATCDTQSQTPFMG